MNYDRKVDICRDKTIADKLMYIPNHDTQNYPFYRSYLHMNTQLNDPTNQNSIKVPKVIKPTKRKHLGIRVINSQLTPPSLENRYVT